MCVEHYVNEVASQGHQVVALPSPIFVPGEDFVELAYMVDGKQTTFPAWIDIAEPFTSVRWAQSGLYDALSYLGSGLAAGLAYWWTGQKAGIPGSNDDTSG